MGNEEERPPMVYVPDKAKKRLKFFVDVWGKMGESGSLWGKMQIWD
jgi:hypothetical protein